MNFKEYLLEDDYNEFVLVLDDLIESLERDGSLNEGIIERLSAKFKDGIEFIKKFTGIIKGNLLDMLKVFKEKAIFAFFSKIKWSINELISIVKKGYKLWRQLHDIIAKYIAETGIVAWSEKKLTELDDYLNAHPIIKRVGSLVVVGFLIYQWTSMISFTGDIDFDFDQSLLFAAIVGSYSLAAIFATPDGIKMLMFIATGVLTGLTFPWPGDAWILFVLSLIYTVAKDKYPAVSRKIINNVKKYKNYKST